MMGITPASIGVKDTAKSPSVPPASATSPPGVDHGDPLGIAASALLITGLGVGLAWLG